MENYIVSARKYRPSSFASVVGQKALTSTLKNAIATDRLAHAYLFCGSRGVGKTSCARIFAKAINCEHRTADGEPCNQCESCRAFNDNRSLNIIELDAASNNSVDDIRALVDQVQVPPTNGRYRIFIVDEVHMLSSAAFNAFLKTLEEPPSYVVFILATTEKHKIIPTILSRCQIYDFNRITVTDMVDHLEYVAGNEGITTERSALNVIARKADGAMRDALSIFDQVAASSRGNITYASTIANLNVLDSAYFGRLMEAFIAQDVPQALLIYKDIRDRGFDSRFFVNGLAEYLRDLMVARDAATLSLLDTDEAVKESMAGLAQKVPIEFFYKAMSLCNDADMEYGKASSKTFLVELLLIKLCQLLSPSPIFSGDGEGQLKPFAASTSTSPEAAAPQAAAQSAQAPAATQPTAAQAPTAPRPVISHAAPPPPPGGPAIGGPATRPSMTQHRALQSTRHRAETRQAEVHAATAERTIRSSSYTDEQLQEAWDAYAAAHSKEHVLVNSMRTCRPKRLNDDKFIVAAVNELQVADFNEVLPDLQQFIHDRLSNDHVTFTFTITDEGPSPTVWNDRELLAHILEDQKAAAFFEALKLKLS